MRIGNKAFLNSLEFLKKRLAEFTGFLLIFISGIFIFSLTKYSPDSPSFILNPERLDLKNYFDSFSNAISDIFLQSFGLISFVIGISILLWGFNLIFEKKINKLLSKFFFTLIYISTGCLFIYIFNNNSFWLIHHGNAGFVGEKSFNLIYDYFPVIENNISKFTLIILFFTFFVLSSGINYKKILIFIYKKVVGGLTKKNEI